MPPVTSYIPGAPAWLDLATGDPDASREFYGSLLGWDFDVWGPETGGYTMCLRDGRRAAGIVPAGSVTPVWTTYLSSDDVDEDTGEGGPQYRVFSTAGQLAGGALQTDGGGSFWLPYFGVADTDATVAAVTGSHGSVLQGPQESAYGKMAVLRDPHGATFAVIEVPEAQS